MQRADDPGQIMTHERRMTDNERRLLDYATAVLRNANDPLVAEAIARSYRSLLFRSRAFELEEVRQILDLLKNIGDRPELTPETRKLINEGPAIAFAALLAHDDVEALSLVDRLGPLTASDQSILPFLLYQAMQTLARDHIILYALWQRLTTSLSPAAIESSTTEWLKLASGYCSVLWPSSRLAAFSVWRQAREWHEWHPSAPGGAALIPAAYQVMVPDDRGLYRMNKVLWEFVQDQESARMLPGEEGQIARIDSLKAALEMSRIEMNADAPDAEVARIWDTAREWMTHDLPDLPSWAALDTQLRKTVDARKKLPPALADAAARADDIGRTWFERHNHEVAESLRLTADPAGWVDRPVYPADWRELDDPAAIRRLLAPACVPGGALHRSGIRIERVRQVTPTFYPTQLLVEVQALFEDNVRGICCIALRGHQQTAVFDGPGGRIHALNQRGLLKRMDEESVAVDYLRFFGSNVWGESGPFRIVESVEDLRLAVELPPNKLAPLRLLLYSQPRSVTQTPDGSWEITRLTCYKATLFETHYRVERDGQIEMTSEHPVAGPLPIRQVVQRDGFRVYEGVWPEGTAQKEHP